MEKAEIARRRGHHAQVVTLLQGAFDASDTPEPLLVLALCDAFIRVDDDAAVAPLLQGLVERNENLSDTQIEQMLILAERQALPDITCRLIEAVTHRTSLSQSLARRLLKLAHVSADGAALRRIGAALGEKVAESERAMFQTDAAALIDGPDAAVGLARQILHSDRTPRKPLIVGRHLSQGGRAGLAMRYLTRALRQWPWNRPLILLYIHACVMARDDDAGHAYLDRMVAQMPKVDVERERLMLMYGKGADRTVLERAAARHDAGLPGLHPQQYLLACLACGDLDRALDAQHSIRSDPGSTSRLAANFTTGLHGRMLTDLQVYRALEASAKKKGQPPEVIEARLAEQYYFPAKQCIDRWEDRATATAMPPETPAPRRIFQYWHSDSIPDDVGSLIAGWKDVPGFEHVLMNRSRAITMLRRQFGQRVVTAFQRARHVTEESDLLRLCLLYRFGGIYSDADDKVVGDIAILAGLGAGLIVTREPIGAIANNTMIAPPGNPILRIALDMTVRAMLARDADGAWFKSGPGMLTRAVAIFLHDTDPDDAGRSLTLLDGATLRQFIEPHIRLPYKTTARYWNAQDRDIGQRVLASLTELAR